MVATDVSENDDRRPGRPRILALAIALLYLALAYKLAGDYSTGRIFGVYTIQAFAALCALTYWVVWMLVLILSRQRRRLNIIRCLTVTAALTFVFLIVEIPAITGIVDYRDWIANQSSAVNSFDPFRDSSKRVDEELITIRKPSQKLSGSTAGNLVTAMGITSATPYPVDATYDQHGFRNRKNFDAATVAIVGDSFIESGLVPEEDLLSSRVSEVLAEPVVNLGQSNYGPQQELVVVRRYALPLNPKLVVWCFFEGNDLKDAFDYRRNLTDWNLTATRRTAFMDRTFTRNLLCSIRDLSSPAAWASKINGSARTGRFITERGSPEQMYFFYDADIMRDQNAAEGFRVTTEVILQARDLTEQNQARFLLLYIPTKFRVYSGLCEFADDSECKKWTVDDFPAVLGDWAKENSISTLDLTESFRAAATLGKLLYFADDTHWNGEANKLAADEVMGFIQRSGWDLKTSN